MKHLFSIVSLILLLNACGPSGDLVVNELQQDPSFNPGDFFNSKISIYTPYTLTFSKQKYPDIEAKDINAVVLKQVKEKLEDLSDDPNIIIEDKKAPEFFRGIKNVNLDGIDLLSSTDSDYLLIIQYVLIGSEIEVRQAMLGWNVDTPIGQIDLSGTNLYNPPKNFNFSTDDKLKTKTTTQTAICYDIWDVKKRASVYTSEASIVLTDGINHKNPYRSIEKVTEALIKKMNREGE